jgi:hypothetical protein
VDFAGSRSTGAARASHHQTADGREELR